jgi:hypothetical protein
LKPEDLVTLVDPAARAPSGESWVPDMPKPFMSGDQAFFGAAISAVWQTGRSVRHELQNIEQLFGDVDLPLIAGVMEGDQDFVGKAPRIPRLRRIWIVLGRVVGT